MWPGPRNFAALEGVERQLHSGRDSEFLENPEQVILDGMLAQIQALGNLAITESLSDHVSDFIFTLA